MTQITPTNMRGNAPFIADGHQARRAAIQRLRQEKAAQKEKKKSEKTNKGSRKTQSKRSQSDARPGKRGQQDKAPAIEAVEGGESDGMEVDDDETAQGGDMLNDGALE